MCTFQNILGREKFVRLHQTVEEYRVKTFVI